MIYHHPRFVSLRNDLATQDWSMSSCTVATNSGSCCQKWKAPRGGDGFSDNLFSHACFPGTPGGPVGRRCNYSRNTVAASGSADEALHTAPTDVLGSPILFFHRHRCSSRNTPQTRVEDQFIRRPPRVCFILIRFLSLQSTGLFIPSHCIKVCPVTGLLGREHVSDTGND
ncbi:hypothetical protein ZHAS_00020726 [Anopheles sinensis]|uniref:Uncharacterized protein n=1 Tax=Anopheles sinensis TaxID=74873 RepID=A0A084WQI9_ANOSI|nr:hypothetical protein ZHAS_00020726 [Anopheles sinensis]